MKTPKIDQTDKKKHISQDYISPSFQDIIKYEQLGKKLQSEAFHSAFKTIKTWLTRLKAPKQSIK